MFTVAGGIILAALFFAFLREILAALIGLIMIVLALVILAAIGLAGGPGLVAVCVFTLLGVAVLLVVDGALKARRKRQSEEKHRRAFSLLIQLRALESCTYLTRFAPMPSVFRGIERQLPPWEVFASADAEQKIAALRPAIEETKAEIVALGFVEPPEPYGLTYDVIAQEPPPIGRVASIWRALCAP